MELTIVSVEEGAYCHQGILKTKPKQKVIVALRAWIQKNGEGGKVYIVAEWKTPPIEAHAGLTLIERKKMPLLKKAKEAPEPDPVEA